MNILFIFILTIILSLVIFLANIQDKETSFIEGYRDKATIYANSMTENTNKINSSPTFTPNPSAGSSQNSNNMSPTINPNVMSSFYPTDGSNPTYNPNPTYNSNNLNIQYNDLAKDIRYQNMISDYSVSDSGNMNSFSKTQGNILYNEPGSLRFGGSNYVPSYEDSVFLSPSTRLRNNQPMYIQSIKDIGFCEFNKNSTQQIENECNQLDKNVCASTSCCVLLGGSKCVAGNKEGPAIRSNYGDSYVRNKDQYFYQGKCYGNCSRTDYSFDNNNFPIIPTTTPTTTPTSYIPTTGFTPTTTSYIPTTGFTPTTTSYIPTTYATGLLLPILQYLQQNKNNLIAFGDSLTYGYIENPTAPPYFLPYTDNLKTLTNNSIPIINKGIPGQTSIDLLNRINNDVLTQSPGLVIVWVGTNDMFSLQVNDIITNITNIHTQIHNAKNNSNTPVYSVAMTLAPNTGINATYNQKRLDINRGIRNMVNTSPFPIFLIDVENLFDPTNPGNVQYWSGAPHFSAIGYAAIGQYIYQQLSQFSIHP
jgi:lysophospholipase L1-like esterase